jgi:hypothetical protein
MGEGRDSRQFKLTLALAGFCALVAAALLWINHAAPRWGVEQRGWTNMVGQLFEVGIRRTADSRAPYEMVARYEYKIADRVYHASRIAGAHSSKSPADIQTLIVHYAAEAAEFSLQDLSELNPQRTWSVAYRPITVSYDPADPARAEMVLDQPLPANVFVTWIVRIIAGMFLFTAAALLAGAGPISRVGPARST